MNVRFACPACDAPDRFDLPGPNPWRCATCGHAVDRPDDPVPAGKLVSCALCGNSQLYRQKDFPQWLGMLILAGACTSFFILAVIFSWNNFVFGIVLAGRETRTLPVAVYNMISFDQLSWGPLAAAALIVTFPVLLLTVTAQRQIVAGLTAGAVKGG